MRYLIAGLCAVFILASSLLMAKEPLTGSLQVLRKPILLDYKTLPLLAVTFNHSSHKRVKCVHCHHLPTEEGVVYAPCTTEGCHSIPGAREREVDSMFMAYHAVDSDRSCYGCHLTRADRHPDWKGCRPCHYKPLQEQASK